MKEAGIAAPSGLLKSVVSPSDAALLVRVANDVALDTARSIAEFSGDHKYGRNPSVAAGTEEVVWDGGGDYTGWLTSPSALRIRAGGDAADSAAGAGAQSILVIGLDQDWNLASKILTTAGVSASAPTTTTFIRVFRARVAESGTYGGSNVDDVTIETVGGVAVAAIKAQAGSTQMALVSVPAGYQAFIDNVNGWISGATNKTVSLKLWVREGADIVVAPFSAPRIQWSADEVSGGRDAGAQFKTPIPVPAKSDIWVTAEAQVNAGSVTARFDYRLVAL